MATVIPFPESRKPQEGKDLFPSETPLQPENNEGYRNIVRAYMLEGSKHVGIGSDIAVEIAGTLYRGSLIKILERDTSNNMSRIMYSIPHFESGDPFKTGEAVFTYIVKTI